jgi:hypothetical protein
MSGRSKTQGGRSTNSVSSSAANLRVIRRLLLLTSLTDDVIADLHLLMMSLLTSLPWLISQEPAIVSSVVLANTNVCNKPRGCSTTWCVTRLSHVPSSTTSKLLKKKLRNTMFSRLSFCFPTNPLFCPGAHKPWLLLLPMENVNSRGFNVSLAKHHFFRNFLWQKCWDSRKLAIFLTFEHYSTLCHTLQSWTWSKPAKHTQSRSESAVCVCALSAL